MTASRKIRKNRLLCVTLPKPLLEKAKAYRRRAGFSSMSELLRAAIEGAPAVLLNKTEQEERTQISFRLPDALYTSLFRAANQSGQSTAKIVRRILENAPKLGVRPAGAPAKKATPAAVPAKKSAASARTASRKTRK